MKDDTEYLQINFGELSTPFSLKLPIKIIPKNQKIVVNINTPDREGVELCRQFLLQCKI
jgi:hypothetical protein